ncbi:MAG: S8 family serine peptidase [Candidatus Gastranaerophilales bacterium]|nr:S8 family serine peptidase [Candidatus Gastranaerophilales bacterium]
MNQKLEELLRLAIMTSEGVREQTESLNVGFDNVSRTWELIVKYHGNLDGLESLGVRVEYLIAGYAILTVPEGLVERMAELEEIEYVEKPKRFFYQAVMPAEGSCLPQVSLRDPFLTGKGVLLAVLDSGIEYRLPDFRKADGSTRIRFLWDQTLAPSEALSRRPPEGFHIGVEFDESAINRALEEASEREQFELLPSRDVSGHGTAVAGIAAGSIIGNGVYGGVAYEADLLAVKLGQPDALGFPRTTEIMRGVAYALKKARELAQPLVINLSFGNNYGSHDGSSLLERFLDNAAEIGQTVICVGSGNEGSAGGHLAGNVSESVSVELAVAEYETSLNVQLWKNYSDVYRIYLRSPGGRELEIPLSIEGGKYTLRLDQTEILVYWGEPAPYSVAQEIYLEMIPVGRSYINSGVWNIRIEPVTVVTGQYYLYLPGSAVRNEQTRFYRPTPQVTLTIPSTAAKVVTVGAYDSIYDSYADFSGRGYVDRVRTIGVVSSGLTKPDLVAPGVGVLAPDVYGGYSPYNGTSFATPIVSGSAALLMEWGIVRGNDPFLYGEKVKAYLRKGARPLRGETELPNERVGWGALCVRESLPE